MLRDDSGNGGGRPKAPRNVLGDRLEDCSMKPLTGFFRDGCCNTSREDIGGHTVCAVMTAEFLEFSKSRGNDLSTPMPEFGFPGLSLHFSRGWRIGVQNQLNLFCDQRVTLIRRG